MSIEDDITRATNQRDALIILGRAFDESQRRFEAAFAELVAKHAPGDPWLTTDWDSPKAHAEAHKVFVAETNVASITALQERLATEHDPQERMALEAQLRLLKDTAANVVGPSVPEGERVVESEGYVAGSPTQDMVIAGSTVTLPVVSEQRQHGRADWARTNKLWDFLPTLTEAETCVAYAKGGPLWLYLGNRAAVMAMPLSWRQEMVADIELDSPAQAQEVGRDILKSTESADRQITIEAVNGS